MRHLLLTLLVMFVALAVNAQTQTEDPVINYSYDEITSTGIIEIYDEDPDAEIYWSFCHDYGSDWTEWMVYSEPVCFTEMGQYTVRAFAISPDKEASDICEFCFVIEESSIYQAYDFIVDGIYYSGERCSEGEVWVSTEYMEFPLNWVLPHAYTQFYHGDVVVPSTVEYEGKTYTVTGIGENAFDNCDVSSVTLPNTITTLYHGAFWSASLKQLTIPSSVTFIGDFAFDCPNLTKIVCMGTTPSQIIDGYMWLVHIIGQATLFVPQESLEAYRGHDEWGKFSRIVPFIGAGPGDVDGDGAIAIDDVTSLIDMLLNGGELPAYVDVDGDGTVDISDVTALIDMLLGVN